MLDKETSRDFPVIGSGDTFCFHASQPTPNHGIQHGKLPLDITEIGRKIIGIATGHSVDPVDQIIGKVVGSDGHVPDFIL